MHASHLVDVLFERSERRAAKQRIDELAAPDATTMVVLTAVVVVRASRVAA